MLAAGMVAILVSGVAVGSLAFSAPERDALSASAPAETPRTAATPTTAGVRSYRLCPGCGVIQSTRKIGAPDAGVTNTAATNSHDRTPPRGDEITVLLQDGSTRVITDANPAKWKYGERISIIAGIDG